MQVRFRVSLGKIDIDAIKNETGVALKTDDCLLGCELDTDERVAEWLLKRGIVEPSEKLKAVAKKPELIAPAKQS